MNVCKDVVKKKRQLVARSTSLQYYNAFTFLSLQYIPLHLPNKGTRDSTGVHYISARATATMFTSRCIHFDHSDGISNLRPCC